MFSKRTMVGLISVLLIGSYALPTGVAEEADSTQNLILNGGFEKQTDGWEVNVFPRDKELAAALLKGVTPTEEQSRSGKGALKIDVLAMDTEKLDSHEKASVISEQKITSRPVSELRGKGIRLTVWVYFECMAEKGPVFHPGPGFVVHFRDKENSLMADKALVVKTDPKILVSLGYNTYADQIGKWIRVEGKGTIPEETCSMEISLSMAAKDDREINTTCVYIDDISLELINGEKL